MPLPTISNVYRVATEFTPGGTGVTPVNVFHVRASGTDALTMGAVLNDALGPSSADMWQFMYTGISASSIKVQKLDGVSAAIDFPLDASIEGGGSGGVLAGICAVLSLHTARVGARGRGRMYIGPCGETQISNSTLDPSDQSTMLAAWSDFIDALNGSSPSTQLVVASYKHADANDVTNIRVDNVVGQQRRRNDQLR